MSKRYHRDGTTVFCYSHADPMTGEGINEVTIDVKTNGIIDAEAFAERLRGLLNGTPLCCDAPMEDVTRGRHGSTVWLCGHCGTRRLVGEAKEPQAGVVSASKSSTHIG